MENKMVAKIAKGLDSEMAVQMVWKAYDLYKKEPAMIFKRNVVVCADCLGKGFNQRQAEHIFANIVKANVFVRTINPKGKRNDRYSVNADLLHQFAQETGIFNKNLTN